MQGIQVARRGVTVLRKIVIWIGVALLYVLMFSPSLFALTNPPTLPTLATSALQGLGLVIMAGGLTLEVLADRQKSAFKARFPKQFCNTGLYRRVRCPNYLGEITFWVGNWIAGLAFYTSPLQWLAATIGVLCIVLIMMGSTKRLERAQDNRYGGLSRIPGVRRLDAGAVPVCSALHAEERSRLSGVADLRFGAPTMIRVRFARKDEHV